MTGLDYLSASARCCRAMNQKDGRARNPARTWFLSRRKCEIRRSVSLSVALIPCYSIERLNAPLLSQALSSSFLNES